MPSFYGSLNLMSMFGAKKPASGWPARRFVPPFLRTPDHVTSEMDEAARFDTLYRSRLAEATCRYDDMISCMRTIVQFSGAETADLSLEERNSFSVSYKNKLDHLRKSWRALTSRHPELTKFEEDVVQQYIAKIETEIKTLCAELQGHLEERLIPAAKDAEAKVFYYKMSGDANRYIAEISKKAGRSEFGEHAKRAYEAARKIAAADLPPTHPSRLGLALNFSVFYFDIVNEPDEACRVAKTAFDEGVAALDSLGEKAYRESTQILQLLCENLNLWNPDASSFDGNFEDDAADYA